MKKTLGLFALLLTISIFTSCSSSAPEGEKVEATDATAEAAATTGVSYGVDTLESVVYWTGSKPTGQHSGTIGVSSGTVSVEAGAITGGEFVIDFSSLTNTDMKPGEGKEDLEGHLKAGDFFEVEKFPTGNFVITGVEAVTGDSTLTHQITGNLTMKDITKSVTIPTNVAMLGDKIMATSKAFTIDRTQWGITFHSSTVSTVADKVINDQVGLVVKLVANK